MIRPQDIIKRNTVEELCGTADRYFASIVDPTEQMAKPFNNLLEAPESLKNMGELLSGLHLAKTMTVLDFAAGTCWFSRYLNQLQCRTISCDVSKAALDIGKKLFDKYPIVGSPITDPEFLLFDGYHINLPDASVERIVCFDGFHHVPNPEVVIAEFARILKPGGIAGFSEPGRNHSQSPLSQYEMKNYNVLENDIDLYDINILALRHGFTEMKVSLPGISAISFSDFSAFEKNKWRTEKRILKHIRQALKTKAVFFLHKGQVQWDSRGHSGLMHRIDIDCNSQLITKGESIRVQLVLTNTGQATWLTEAIQEIGLVKLGTHLYNTQGELIELDFSRHALPKPLRPGDSINVEIAIPFPDVGEYLLTFDLVAEKICWFGNLGSQTKTIEVKVTE